MKTVVAGVMGSQPNAATEAYKQASELADGNSQPQTQTDSVTKELYNLSLIHILKDRLIDQRYRIQFPITKKFQEEDTWPKFIGGMSTLWDVSKMEMRETEYD